MNAQTSTTTIYKPKAFPVIVWGGLLAGVLDAANGIVAYGMLGLNPIQVLQYIASGALGGAAFTRGLLAAAAGALFHFFIAFIVAAVFYFGSRAIPQLAKHYVAFGLAYGAAVYLVMNYLVLPLSAVAPSQFSLPLFLNGVIGHAIFVGLPVAWCAHRSAMTQAA